MIAMANERTSDHLEDVQDERIESDRAWVDARRLAGCRAAEDVSAGRVYRLGEDFLVALARAGEAVGRPLDRDEVNAVVQRGLVEGRVEMVANDRPAVSLESSGA
jgi:hypothetical protein